MPPPQAIVCHLCNGKYFKRSWPIHLKQCESKWKDTHSRCEYCGAAVANDDWQDHRVHCKPNLKKKKKIATDVPLEVPKAADNESLSAPMCTAVMECEECEAEQAMRQCVQCEQKLCAMCDVSLHKKGARARHRRNPLNAKALLNVADTDADGTLCAPTFEPEKDQRAECKFCARRFNPDRVEKHMRICSKAEKKWQKRKPYDGAKKRIEGTEFKQFEHNRSATPEEVKEWRKHGRRWKDESAQIRGAAGVPELDIAETVTVPSLAKAKKALAAEEAFLKAKEDPKRVFKKALEMRVSLLPKKKVSPPNSGRSNSSAKSSARSTRSTWAKSSNVFSARGSGTAVPRNKRPIKSMKQPVPAKARGPRARASSNAPSECSFSSRSSARSNGSRSSRIKSQNSKKVVNPKELSLGATGSSVRGQRRTANVKKSAVGSNARAAANAKNAAVRASAKERKERTANARATAERLAQDNAAKGGNAAPKSKKRKKDIVE